MSETVLPADAAGLGLVADILAAFLQDPDPERIVVLGFDESLWGGRLDLPSIPGVRLILRGGGPNGRTRLLGTGLSGWVRAEAGASVLLQRLDWEPLGIGDGALPAMGEPGIGVRPNATVEVKDCSLRWAGQRGIGIGTVAAGPVQREGDGVGLTLTGARLFGWETGLAVETPAEDTSASLRVSASGFRDCAQGVSIRDGADVEVAETRFDLCDTGLRLWRFLPHEKAVAATVARNQFTDCLLGLEIDDLAGSRVGTEGPQIAPADSPGSATGRLEPRGGPTIGTSDAQAVFLPTRYHIERNEFRAPSVRRFPDSAAPYQWERPGACGASIRLSGPMLVGPTSVPSRAILSGNLFHLLDTGLDLRPGEAGECQVVWNTFVANSRRSVRIRGQEDDWRGGGPCRVVVAANLFLGRIDRPRLGLAEGQTWDSPNGMMYLFGAVELEEVWTAERFKRDPALDPSHALLVVRNVFRDHWALPEGNSEPLFYEVEPDPRADASGVPPVFWYDPVNVAGYNFFDHGDHRHRGTAWENAVVVDPMDAGVLRLPRVRLPGEGDGTVFVAFDYHCKRCGEEEDWGLEDADLAVLRGWGIAVEPPDVDLEGRRRLWPMVAGAFESEPAWKQFPLIGQGAGPGGPADGIVLPGEPGYGTAADDPALSFDAVSYGRTISPERGLYDRDAFPATEPDGIFQMFYGGSLTSFADDLVRARLAGLSVVMSVEWEASLKPPTDWPSNGQVLNTDVDGNVTRFVFDDGLEIPIFGSPDSVYTEQFVLWFLARVDQLLERLAVIDPGGTVVMFATTEEFSTTINALPVATAAKQSLCHRLRTRIQQIDPRRRRLISYQGSLGSPHIGTIYPMLGVTGDGETPDGSPYLKGSVDPNAASWRLRYMTHPASAWTDPVDDGELATVQQFEACWTETSAGWIHQGDATLCKTAYASRFRMWRDETGALKLLQDHCYHTDFMFTLSYSFPGVRDRNRVFAFHQQRLARETLDNVQAALDTNLDRMLACPLGFLDFWMWGRGEEEPLSEAEWNALRPASHARHDVWAGIHLADGVILNAWPYRKYLDAAGTTQFRDSWPAVAESLAVLKNNPDLREAIVNGERARGWFWDAASLSAVHEGGDWIEVTVWPPVVALGRAYGSEMGKIGEDLPGVQWTAWRVGNVAWVVVTCSSMLLASDSRNEQGPLAPSLQVFVSVPGTSSSTWQLRVPSTTSPVSASGFGLTFSQMGAYVVRVTLGAQSVP